MAVHGIASVFNVSMRFEKADTLDLCGSTDGRSGPIVARDSLSVNFPFPWARSLSNVVSYGTVAVDSQNKSAGVCRGIGDTF